MPAKNNTTFFGKIGKYIKYIIFATNIVAIILLLMSYLSWTVEPSKMIFFSYLGLGFIFILALNIFYLIIWAILLKWKLVLMQLAVLIICWSPISTYLPIHFKTEEVPEESIKFLTYNVKGFNWKTGKSALKNPIIEYIANSGADIVCLQELLVSEEKKDGHPISRKELNNLLKDYPYRSIEKVGVGHSYTYGIACYSKYPIKKVEKIPIWSTYNGAIIYHLEIKGKTVTIINNHLESNRITSSDVKLYRQFFKSKEKDKFDEVANNIQNKMGTAFNIREVQVKTIKEYIDKDTSDALIVCGDFNDTPISYTYNTVKGDLIDAYASTGLGQGITYHENKFWFRIDYIMHSRNIKSYNCTVDRSIKHSDHYPVWTYLKIE